MLIAIGHWSSLHPDFFQWIILPFLIVMGRIIDVSISTIRVICVARGKKNMAPFFGFFEVTIWLVGMTLVMKNLNNVACYIGYGVGFAMGTYIGMRIAEKMAVGMMVVRVVVSQGAELLKTKLVQSGFGVTVMDGEGANSQVKIISSIIKGKDLERIKKIIHQSISDAFYYIEDTSSVHHGIFPKDTRAGFGLSGVFSKR